MRRRRAFSLEPEEEFNLTPLLDVVFIILIFFVVTASFVKDTGVDVDRPSAQSAVHKERTLVHIASTAQEQVWIDDRNVGITGVRARLERLHAQNPEGGVVIQADRRATTGLLVAVLDQVRLAGIDEIAIAADQTGP
ncbi:MAG: biopolymer transporter ExbD [Sedimenticolaceae bacterium]